MRIIKNLNEKLPSKQSVVLTIGNFDGVHRGHMAVLNRTKELSNQVKGQTTVLTFENHPTQILRPSEHVKLICSLPHKIQLLEKFGIDNLILLPFTKEFSQHTAEEFLRSVSDCMPFTHLILGHDATLGKDRKGDRRLVEETAKSMGFQVEYLEPYRMAGSIVSSSEIRRLINHGQLPQVETLLGRKYSIYGPVIIGKSAGKTIGFPTANIDVGELCVPVFGVYAVHLLHDGKVYDAIANLGVAPTVRKDLRPILEVHLLDKQLDLYDHYVEVIFYDYIRSERKFADLNQLREQIEFDTTVARKLLAREV